MPLSDTSPSLVKSVMLAKLPSRDVVWEKSKTRFLVPPSRPLERASESPTRFVSARRFTAPPKLWLPLVSIMPPPRRAVVSPTVVKLASGVTPPAIPLKVTLLAVTASPKPPSTVPPN